MCQMGLALWVGDLPVVIYSFYVVMYSFYMVIDSPPDGFCPNDQHIKAVIAKCKGRMIALEALEWFREQK